MIEESVIRKNRRTQLYPPAEGIPILNSIMIIKI